MAISRMQNPRQLYGLGSLVKKATRGIKKIVKSPIGKAALIGGLGAWGMGAGPFSKVAGQGWLKGLLGKIGASKMAAGPMKYLQPGGGLRGFAGKWLNPFNKANPLLYTGGQLSGKKMFGLGAGALIAAPFVQKALGYGPYQDVEEEVDDWTVTPSSIASIRNMAKAQDPSLAFLPSSNYTQSGWYGADGGVVGLANGGNPGEAQMEQMLRAEYLKYRNKGGTMPYEQFKILVMKQSQQGQMPNQMMAAGGRIGFFDGGSFKDFLETNIGHLDESIQDDIWDAYGSGDQGRLIKLLQIHIGFENRAQGGRAGYYDGELVEQQTDFIEGPQGGEEFQETVVEGQEQPSREQLEALAIEIFQLPLDDLDEQQLLVVYREAMQGQPMEEAVQEEDVQFAANGGIMGNEEEDDVLHQNKAMSMYRSRRQEGGLMDLQGQEKDYRDEGGFVALGGEERADDVPARLSKNEFVFTADAVRNAGGGDIDRGSEVMQNLMDNLEEGGEVSEDSQGLQGGEEIISEEMVEDINPAQGMYDNYEQLQSRVG
jgi:hypothetical protein